MVRQPFKETDNFLMTRPGSDAELHPVVVSEFPASLLSTKCAEVIFCFVLEVGHLQGLPPS